MPRLTLTAATTLVALALAATAVAQTEPPAGARRGNAPAPTRPPLFFSESWKALPTPTDDHGEWPASQAGVASPNLQLSLYGPSGKDITLVRSRGETYPLNLWTGVTTSPIGATLKDKANYVDLSDPLAKIRWIIRTSGFHQVRPLIKLADGTWLVGDRTTGPQTDFDESEISFADVHWIKIDPARMVTIGNLVEHPDLRKVDEVGFADLMPGSGHGNGGWVNVARIEVFGRPVER